MNQYATRWPSSRDDSSSWPEFLSLNLFCDGAMYPRDSSVDLIETRVGIRRNDGQVLSSHNILRVVGIKSIFGRLPLPINLEFPPYAIKLSRTERTAAALLSLVITGYVVARIPSIIRFYFPSTWTVVWIAPTGEEALWLRFLPNDPVTAYSPKLPLWIAGLL